MPTITLPLTPDGPVLKLGVAVDLPLSQALRSQNRPVPNPVAATLLIDTGASHTNIDSRILSQLPLQPRNQVEVHTPSTNGVPVYCNQYSVALIGLPLILVPAILVTGASFQGQNIDGLLGRDVLGGCVLTYNGPGKHFILSY